MLDMSPAKRNRLILWIALLVLVAGVLWVSRKVLLPYILGLILAYLLLPLVNWLDRRMPARLHKWKVSRALAIVLTYFLMFLLVAGLVAFVLPVVIEQVQILVEYWPTLTEEVQDWGTRGWGWYNAAIDGIERFSPTWRETIETSLKNLAEEVIQVLQSGVVATVRTISSTVSFIIGLVVIPFWLFYILHDESQVKQGVMHALPQQLRADVRCMGSLVDDVLSAYIRGQLLLVLFVGGMATVALTIIGVPFSLLLGIIAGIFEVLPFIGPILGAIPALVVALLSDPVSAIWVILAFFAIQQVENLILVPRISGESVKLHPAVVMVVLVVGNEMAGFWGMIIAVPVTAMIRDVFKYLYLRFQDEPLDPEQAMTSIRSGQEVQLGV